MINKLRVRAQSESGFTLVELLVVMLILGLLAAIAIPAFFNQRDKARDADAKAHARTAQTALETYATDNDGAYTGATNARLIEIEPSLGDATFTGEPTVTATTFAVETESDTGNTFEISKDGNGVLDSDCVTHGEGGCPPDGNWAGDGAAPPPAP
jgi:type IV pilus assembly protein PilA